MLLGNFCETDEPTAEELTSLSPVRPATYGALETPVSITRQKSSLLKRSRQAELSPTKYVPYPFVLVSAVITDSIVDGFLIGITSVSGHTAGLVMSIALSVEMGFLGLTFATTMRKQPRVIGVLSVLAPPVFLAVGGCVGALLAGFMATTPALHVALISFGMAALLYLVTEELLLEAHEALGTDGQSHIWWVDLCFFVGFLASFLLEKASDYEEARPF